MWSLKDLISLLYVLMSLWPSDQNVLLTNFNSMMRFLRICRLNSLWASMQEVCCHRQSRRRFHSHHHEQTNEYRLQLSRHFTGKWSFRKEDDKKKAFWTRSLTRYLIFISPLLFETTTPPIYHLSELMQSADLFILRLYYRTVLLDMCWMTVISPNTS